MDAFAIAFLGGVIGALIWKSTAVIALAWLAARGLARGSAAVRHGVWTLAVAVLLALPIAQAVTPRLELPVLPAAPAPVHGAHTKTATARAHQASTRGGAAMPSAARVAAPAPPLPQRTAWPWRRWLAALWLAGAVAVLGTFAAGRIALRSLALRARVLEDPAWREATDSLARRMGVQRRIRLLVTDQALPALTWGSLRPTILVSEEALRWPEEQRRAFLIHELAHVARHDCAIQDAAHLACAFYWFHPGVWHAAHRLRVEREAACDDRVLLDGGVRASAYAQQLVDFVRAARSPRLPLAWSGAPMAAPSQLESRVRALLDDARDRRRLQRGPAAAAALIALVVLLPLAAVAPAAGTSPHPPAETITGSLDLRFHAALAEGGTQHHGHPFWLAYAIPYASTHPGQEILMSDTEGWNTADLEKRKPTLADRYGFQSEDAVLLFHVPASGCSASFPFDRIAIRSAKLAARLDGAPITSLGRSDVNASLDWIQGQLEHAPHGELGSILVSALALHPSTRTEPLLEKILDGRGVDDFRREAAAGLSRHPGASALDALVKHVKTDRSEEVRRESAEAIGELPYPPATATLVTLARELDDENVRLEAVEALGAREPESVLATLVAIANEDPSEAVRREAVETMGELKAGAGKKTLLELKHHRDPAVREEAAETLDDMARMEREAKKH